MELFVRVFRQENNNVENVPKEFFNGDEFNFMCLFVDQLHTVTKNGDKIKPYKCQKEKQNGVEVVKSV